MKNAQKTPNFQKGIGRQSTPDTDCAFFLILNDSDGQYWLRLKKARKFSFCSCVSNQADLILLNNTGMFKKLILLMLINM